MSRIALRRMKRRWRSSGKDPLARLNSFIRSSVGLHVFVFAFFVSSFFCFDVLVQVSAQVRVTVANQHYNLGQDSLFSVCFFLLVFYLFFLRGSLFSWNACSHACLETVLNLACRDARVVKDTATGKSKGYGFVSFYNKLVRLQCKNTDWRLFLFSVYSPTWINF